MTSTTSDLPVIPYAVGGVPPCTATEFAELASQSPAFSGRCGTANRLGRAATRTSEPRWSTRDFGGTLPDLLMRRTATRRRLFSRERRSRASPIAADDDQPIHLPAHQPMRPQIQNGRRISGGDDRQGSARRHRAGLRPAGAVAGDRAAAGGPARDLELFQHNTSVGLDVNSTDEERARGFIEMYAYIQEFVTRKEREPGDDLISRLITDYVSNGQLDYNTVAVNAVIMMQAGHETTANMISLGTVALLEHPEVFERLGQTDDAAVITNAIEELMRYLSIVHAQVDRIATEDLVLGGQQIRAGDRSLMNLPAGNWNSEFVDDPETLDIARNAAGMSLSATEPQHRSQPGQSRDAGGVRHLGAPSSRTSACGAAR